MIAMAANWRLLLQRPAAWLLYCPLLIGFGIAVFSGGSGNAASAHSPAALFLWMAAFAGALSAIVWKEAMGKPHAFCLPKRKYETGAVSVISATLLLFILASIRLAIRLPVEGGNAFTEATALFLYGCVAFFIGTQMAFRFSTTIVFAVLLLLPMFAMSILNDVDSFIAGISGTFLLTAPLVSIAVGLVAAIGLGFYTWTRTDRIAQRRKLCIAADPGLAVFDVKKVMQIRRIQEQQAAAKVQPASIEAVREHREAFFLGRLRRVRTNPAEQYMWGYLYRWIGNPKIMRRSTFLHQIIALFGVGAFFAWLGRNGDMENSFLPFLCSMVGGLSTPLPLLRPMPLIAGRSGRMRTVMVLFLAYTLLAIGMLLMLHSAMWGTGVLASMVALPAHGLHAPSLGWTTLTTPIFILPILFLARLRLLGHWGPWAVGIAYLIGVGPLVLLMYLPPLYQAGLGVLMWAWCIHRYRRHFQLGPLVCQGSGDSQSLLLRG